MKRETAPGEKGGSPRIICGDDHQQFTEWPRPAREIRDELVAIAHDAWRRRDRVDPGRLDALADELAWAAAIARVYGGDASALEKYEHATRETAELARLTRQAVAA